MSCLLSSSIFGSVAWRENNTKPESNNCQPSARRPLHQIFACLSARFLRCHGSFMFLPTAGNAKPLCVDYSSGGKYRCRPKTQWICCPGSYCRTQMRGALCRNPSTTRGSLNLERRGPQQSVSDRSWPACAGVRSSACSVARERKKTCMDVSET